MDDEQFFFARKHLQTNEQITEADQSHYELFLCLLETLRLDYESKPNEQL